MPSERQMWEALQPHMAERGLDPVRVENPAGPGTPDVNYIEGWIELKHADGWPVQGGPLRLKHPPAPQQKVWAFRRWLAGGTVSLLLRVGHEWFVFLGKDVREVWASGDPLEQLIRRRAHKVFRSPAEVAQFYTYFKNDTEHDH